MVDPTRRRLQRRRHERPVVAGQRRQHLDLVDERDDDRVDRVRGQRPDHLDGASGQRRVRQAKLGDFHEWNGLAVLPTLPASHAGMGRRKEHCHVRQVQLGHCHDGHRYREELVSSRRSPRKAAS
jgi:hypothetical protein